MAVRQIHAKALARLLNRAVQPVYVLDDELTIVFFNRECINWLGQLSDQLLGTKCIYHTPADFSSPDTVAAGLCPPPGLFPAKSFRLRYTIKMRMAKHGGDSAWFFPFRSLRAICSAWLPLSI